jgi:hypothetical protein
MSKVYGLVMAALTAIVMASPARADVTVTNAVAALQNATAVQAQAFAGLDWRVGDKASYKLSNIILNGTIDAFVREDTGTAYWMEQNMSVMGQAQKVEILLNKSTGQIEKLLVNGKEEKMPAANVEIVEMKESNVTVPAGTFDCIYAKIKNKDDGKISQAWINGKVAPMTGQLKAVAESQFGEITQEATSFQFAPR